MKGPARKALAGPDLSYKASAVLNAHETEIEAVAFFTESISEEINGGFSKILNTSMFSEIAKIYVAFVLIHELVHVQQIKNGMTLEEYRRTSYENNQFEREANEKAMEILSRNGSFQREVATMVASKSYLKDNLLLMGLGLDSSHSSAKIFEEMVMVPIHQRSNHLKRREWSKSED
jgi:hypothetical protein